MHAKELWEKLLANIEKKIGKDSCEMWLKPVKPLIFENDKLTIEMPDHVWYSTIKNRYEEDVLTSLKDVLGKDIELKYNVPIKEEKEQKAVDKTKTIMKSLPKTAPSTISITKNALAHRLNDKHTFEGFIEGPSNRFAYRAAQAVEKKLGNRENNPLVIYSSPGLGKTHLLHAIGNEILKNNKNKKVLYMSGEEFVSEYIESLQKKTSGSFRKKYRSLDCLLVDDIQFVAGKHASEKEFFYTFNTLFESKKQIVLTSDRTPQQLSLDNRLASRLLSGIVSEIKKPDLETRIAILRQKRDQQNFVVSDDVLAFTAAGVKASIRELEGCLYRLNSYCYIQGIEPTVDIAKEVLADIITLEEEGGQINVDSIKKIVGAHFKIEMSDFISKKKTQAISWPRQVAMFLANDLTDMSLPEIGRAFNRDHSTVVHARDQIKKEIKENPFFAAEINQIINEVKVVDKS